ncbi:MAG: hypothetical protein HQL32_15435, partial [Planctomycetes bacterium]|nr:hypothetical protein [Planctomycetota bacterium]
MKMKKANQLTAIGMILLVVGGILSLLSFFSESSHESFASHFLYGISFVWTISIGSFFFILLHHLTGAVWSVVFRRIAEMYASFMWWLFALFLVLLLMIFFGNYDLYSWYSHPDALTLKKSAFLNSNFFMLRTVFYFAVWTLASSSYIKNSINQDEHQDEKTLGLTPKMRARSTWLMLLLALTLSFAAFDWFMSIDAHWFSTLFGVYVFAGVVLTSLSAITLAAIWLSKADVDGMGLIRKEHYYSLGALMFAFSCFWAYMWFS